MGMLRIIPRIWESRQMLLSIAASQLRVKYAGTLIGAAWGVINPIAVTLAIIFAFSAVLKINMEKFPLFVLCGFFPWTFFAGTVSEAARSLLDRRDMLRQLNFPREVIPLAYALAGFGDFLRGWIFMLPLFVFFNPHSILYLLWFPVILLFNFLFVCGICMAISVLNVFYRDVAHMLNLGLLFWFWTTPIFYPANMIPARYSWIIVLNPLATFIEFYRAILFTAQMPSLLMISAALGWSLLSFFLGAIIFRRMDSDLLKRI